MKVLVTNDDGYDSPLLHALVEQLCDQSWIDHVDVVVPATEQSWIGSAVNKRGVKNIRTKVINSQIYHIVNGSPADCTSLGCSCLFDCKPDIVFSGINFGVNAGVCFYLSSGTISGARQASLFNVPGISCSSALPRDIFMLWAARDFAKLSSYDSLFHNIARVQVAISRALIEKKIFDTGRNDKVDFVSINTPEEIKEDIPTLTTLEPTRFKPIFKKISDNRFEHLFEGFIEKNSEENYFSESIMTDFEALQKGKNSVTMFNVDQHGEIRIPAIF